MAAETHTNPDLESIQLYQACQSEDLQMQAAAYDRLWSCLCRVVLKMVNDQPDAEALAEEYAQRALIRVYEHIAECRDPAKFTAWARRIVKNIVLNELRQQRRLLPLEAAEWESSSSEDLVQRLYTDELFALIALAPISASSRRLVIGAYQDNHPDDHLAREESRLSGRPMAPSHVQVIRSKDIFKLRSWEPLRTFIGVEEGE
jgi:RNA polymerase sigma factor (sigma-70 family)